MENDYKSIVRTLIDMHIDNFDYKEFYSTRDEAINARLLEEIEDVDFAFTNTQKRKEELSLIYTSNENRFRESNYKTWEEAFKQTQSFIMTIEEIFYEYRQSLHEMPNEVFNRKKNQYHVFFQLYARAFQEFLEIFTLLKNGFASGAFARWRTMYERVIIATFISTSQTPEKVAAAFIESAYDFDDSTQNDYYNWAKIDSRFIDRVNFKNPEKRNKANKIIVKLNMLKEACPVNQIYFQQDEYKFASSILHSSTKGTFHSISEPDPEYSVVIGHSSIGIFEPAVNAIRSIIQMTKFYISVYGSNKVCFYAGLLSKWDDFLYNTYADIYEKTKDLPIKEGDNGSFIT